MKFQNWSFLLFIIFPLVALAQPGALDTTFGSAGIVFMDQSFNANIAVLPDGKMLAFKAFEKPDLNCNLLFRRFNEDGSPDTLFGSNSFLTIDFYESDSFEYYCLQPKAIAVLPNEKVLIFGGSATRDSSGVVSSDVFVFRMNFDGLIDSSFGVKGKVFLDIEGYADEAREMSVLPDGRIVLFLNSYWQTFPFRGYSFVRLQENGMLDASYGQGGIASYPQGEIEPGFAHFCAHDNGIITLAGDFNKFTSLYQFDNTGKPDSTFGQFGHATADISNSHEEISQTVALPGGKILTCGWGFLGGSVVISVCRFLPNGSLDTTFHGDGFLLDPIAAFDSESNAMIVQPDGKIVVAGYAIFSDGKPDWLLVRYQTDGSSDQTFGNNGYMRTDFQSPWEETIAYITPTPDGNILASGWSATGWKLAKYLTGSLVSVSNPESESKNTINLFPNPVMLNNSVQIRHYLSEKQQYSVQVMDVKGCLIYSEDVKGDSGWNEHRVLIPSFPHSGFYVLRVETKAGVQSALFLKS